MIRSRLTTGLVLSAAVAVVLGATLISVDATWQPPTRIVGVPRGYVADLVRNLVLFAPLGIGLELAGIRTWRALGLAFALSAAVEIAQLFIPGRFASAWDVGSNVAGAALGVAVTRSAASWLFPSRAVASRLCLAAGVAGSLTLAGTGLLMAPALTEAPYYAHWTPRLPHLEPYSGRLRDVRFDGKPLTPGRLGWTARLRTALGRNYDLRLSVDAGSPPPGLSSILLITDIDQREILLLGPDRADLVYRVRNRAAALGFETWGLRLPGALQGVRPGERLEIRLKAEGKHLCLDLNAAAHCDLGFTIGDGWTLLVPPAHLRPLPRALLNASWVGLLFMPLGFWFRRGCASALAVAMAAATVALAPAGTFLLTSTAGELAGACAGLALGVGAGRIARLLA